MLEQSKRNGPVFLSETDDGKLATRRVDIPEIEFGIHRDIIIHRNPRTDKILVEDVSTQSGYVYNQKGELLAEVSPSTNDDDLLTHYRYGIAQIDGKKHNYLIQNEPPVDLEDFPDFSSFEMPPSLVGYPYDMEFTFSDDLITLLSKVKATYVDKYKRPINAELIESQLFLPIGINKVTTTFSQIANKHKNFPIVCDLSDTEYGLLDLEPGYSEEDREEAESYPIVYQEETPRGGIHYLIRTSSDAFKYRISPKLEVIVNAMVSFYGINGQFRNLMAEPIAEFKNATEVGHNVIEVFETSSDIATIVDDLQNSPANELRRQQAEKDVANTYIVIDDMSLADYVSLKIIYEQIIEPNLVNTDDNKLVNKDIPWVMAEYLSRLIEFRLKHNREIRGVPYLVYVATQVLSKKSLDFQ